MTVNQLHDLFKAIMAKEKELIAEASENDRITFPRIILANAISTVICDKMREVSQ